MCSASTTESPLFTDEQLELAFSFHMVQRLIGADDAVDTAEIAFMETLLPRSSLVDAGFLTADGTYTPAWRAALDMALVELATRLCEERKVGIMKTLIEASLADREFDASEGSLVLQAATLLGLEGEALDRALGHEAVGTVDLPAPQ